MATFGKNRGGADIGPSIQIVRAYWEGLRSGGNLPTREQIDPRGIEGALHGAFLVERIAPGIGRLRIAGMTLVELMGMEVRGMPLTALFAPSGRARLSAGLEQVFTRPAVAKLWLEADRGIGRSALQARMMLLPLRGDGTRADVALGCLDLVGAPGCAPCRMTLRDLRLEPLDATRPDLRRPEARLFAQLAAAPETAMAEARQPCQVQPSRSQRPYLRLVKLGEG